MSSTVLYTYTRISFLNFHNVILKISTDN